MILARLIRLLGAEEYALIRTTWMTKIFVTGDVISFLAQGAGESKSPNIPTVNCHCSVCSRTDRRKGGGLLAKAKTHNDQKMGESVILGGLGIQILFFGFFIATTVTFHRRINKNPTARSYSVTGPWRQHILALYVSSALIMIRSVFRMIEFGMGNDSVLMGNEGYLLGLDGALMLIVAMAFLWSHPSRALRGYKETEVLTSMESGRNTAESSYQMLNVGGEGQPAGAKASAVYDASSDGTVMGQPGYGYDVAQGPSQYSSTYGR
jgi:hypothetical protein